MKNILVFSIFIGGLLVSCEKPGTEILYSEAYLELDAATTLTGSRDYIYQRVDDGEPIPSGFIVNLAAAQRSTPVTVHFEVDHGSSTAIENVHFTVSGNTATILPNTSSVELPIMILDEKILGGEVWTIVVNLTGGDLPVNPYYATGTHRIGVNCPEIGSRFLGDYAITYDDATFPINELETFGPAGSIVTLEETQDGTLPSRKFSFIYQQSGNFGNDPATLVLDFNCGRVTVRPSGGLGVGCGDGEITIGPADEFGIYQSDDDEFFTLVFKEFVEDGGCGIAPVVQKVTFTKR